jgi:phosphosulfolactate synthase
VISLKVQMAMTELAWSGIIDHAWVPRSGRPRERGLTMVIDTGLGLAITRDVIETAGPYIDHWKLGFGTSAAVPRELLRRKLSLLSSHGFLTYPGGTLLEVAIVQQHCRVFMGRARDLGFSAVEISDGTLPLPLPRRRNVIRCAVDAGLVAITEVGKKDPAAQLDASELAELALQDMEWGASWVLVEGRESGKSVGIYDENGEIWFEMLDRIAKAMGDKIDRLIWEAPLKPQQAALVRRFGNEVSLGNIEWNGVLALEALRAGLRFETLQPIVERRQLLGQWKPEQVEKELGVKVNG